MLTLVHRWVILRQAVLVNLFRQVRSADLAAAEVRQTAGSICNCGLAGNYFWQKPGKKKDEELSSFFLRLKCTTSR